MGNFLRLWMLSIILSTGLSGFVSAQAATRQIYISENVAASDSSGSSDKGMRALAAVAILGTGAAVIASSAKRGGYLPQFSIGGSHPASHQAQYRAKHQVNHQLKPADPQLQRKLLKLLHNDRRTASRLLAQIQRTHPDRSANWVIEKVIYDLERDRNRH